METEIKAIVPDWASRMNCAVTVCDKNLVILYMNERSRETFSARGGGSLIGASLADCHSERSMGIIAHMLKTGESNCYTIEKHGLKKMIYQTPWRDAKGEIAGLVEISMVIPAELPHYIR